MADDIYEVGADFSGLDEAVVGSARHLQEFNKVVQQSITALEGAEASLEGIKVVFTRTTESGAKLATVVGDIEGEVSRLGSTIGVNADKMARYQQVIKSNVGVSEDYLSVTNALNAAQATTQSALDRTNARLEEQRRIAGQLIANQLKTNTFNTPNVGLTSPESRAKFASDIGAIQEAIQKGQVDFLRAQQIIGEVLGGQGKVYVGNERQFASMVERVKSSAQGLDAEFRKEDAQRKKEAADRILEQQKIADATAKQAFELTRIQADQRRAAAEEAQRAADAQLRQQQASQLSNPLRSQFIGPAVGSQAEIARVASAIAKIQDLVAAGTVSAQRAMQIIQSVMQGTGEVFTGTEKQVAGAAREAVLAQQAIGTEAKKLGGSLEDAGEKGRAAATKILLSWQQLVRLLLIQVLHSAISSFVNAVRSAITEAAEFQIKISEIRTISQENQLSTTQWADAIKGLSDQFGKPLGDVAKGLYETISNQMGQGAEAAKFLATSLRFSNAAVTSSENAVNLLSSALNAYNLSTGEAERVAASFFKTIDLGRVRADDLANSFGRIAPLAANLGISLDELNASIATITIQGVKPSEALTAINGVMTKLLRPTKEMTEQFKEWGVDSGRAAIATFGFEGTLKKLATAAQEGRAEIAELFNEIRATRGFVGLTRVFDNFSTTLTKIRDTGVAQYLEAQAIGVESAGKKFEIETNKIKNSFINAGATIVNFLVNVTTTTDATGKQTVHLAEAFDSIFRVISVAAGSFVIYKGVQLASALATKIHEAALNSYAVASGNAAAADTLHTLALRAKTIALATSTKFQNLLSSSALDSLRVNQRATQVLRAQAEATSLLNGTVITQNVQLVVFNSLAKTAALVGAAILTKAFVTLRTVVNTLGLPGVAIGAFLVYDSMKRAADEAANFQAQKEQELNGLVEERTKKIQANLDQQTKAVETAVKRQFELYLQNSVTVQNLFAQVSAAQSRATKLSTDEMKNSFDILSNSLSKNITHLGDQANKAIDNIKRANEQIFAVQENLEEGRFQRQVKLLEGPAQVEALIKKEEERRRTSQNLLSAPSTSAEEGAANLNKAIKENQDAERLTNDLLDRRITAEKEVKKLQDEILDAQRKSNDIENLHGQADKIRQLRAEAQDAKTPARRRNAAQEELKAILREAQGEHADSEEARQSQEAAIHLANLQEQLAKEQELLKLLPTREGFEKKFAAYAQDQTTALQKYIAMQEQLRLQSERQAEFEKRRLETLKDTFKSLSEFEISTTDDKSGNKFKVTDQTEKLAALKEFDLRAKAAQDAGLTDQSVIAKIAEQRVQLEKKADQQIAQNQFEQQRENLITARDQIIKQQQDIATQEKKIITEREANLQRLQDRAEELSKLMAKGNIATNLGLFRNANTPEFTKALEDFRKNPKSEQAAKALVDQFAEVMNETIAKNTGVFQSKLSVSPKDIEVKTGRTAANVQNEFLKALNEISIGFKQEGDINKAKGALDRALNRLGIKPEIDPLDDTTVKINKFGNEYIQSIQTTTQTVIQLNQAIISTRDYLQSLVPGGQPQTKASGGSVFWRARGMDTVPAMLTPGEFVVRASVARRHASLLARLNSGGSPTYLAEGGVVKSPVAQTIDRISVAPAPVMDNSIGDIHVHIDSKGQPAVDARELAQAVKREVYYGRLNLPTRRRS